MKPPSRQLQTLKAELFRALANPIRIRLLEVLVMTDERSVQDLGRTLGISQPIVSQQLARLRASGIVVSVHSGARTRYSAADPLIRDLLLVARQILNGRLVGVQSLLRELERGSSIESQSDRSTSARSPSSRGTRRAPRR
jgi:ArsR family transcriptional regulator